MDDKTKAYRDELADNHAFSGKFSNNNDEAGNAFGSYKDGFDAGYAYAKSKSEDFYLDMVKANDACHVVEKHLLEEQLKIAVEALKKLAQFEITIGYECGVYDHKIGTFRRDIRHETRAMNPAIEALEKLGVK